MSAMDKVKNALHLNKDHTTTSTTHNTTAGTTHTGNGVPEGTAGPHTSRVANAADPRIDSDLDGSRNFGATTGNTANSAYTSSNAGSGYGARVDSNLDGSRNAGLASGVTGASAYSSGTGTAHATHGHHGTSGSVAADNHSARVGPTGTSTTGGVAGAGVGSHITPGSGNAPNTAGHGPLPTPNHITPRVDSDLSGGKTYGGNKTHA
ncbi:hypothetical protein BDZ45DRAFT_726788 [Acephala macrosclerotiorum]|nr:hypothetical protein BDZ45DRAFT_726788 [Acephala macrosclerotiorum]